MQRQNGTEEVRCDMRWLSSRVFCHRWSCISHCYVFSIILHVSFLILGTGKSVIAQLSSAGVVEVCCSNMHVKQLIMPASFTCVLP
jgi:hypothetical protein